MQKKKYFNHNGDSYFAVGDTIKIRNVEVRDKIRRDGKKWVKSGGTEEWLTAITVYKK